ncbi:hypothetical protein [Bradyrhizobium yuanmingense]|uniref:hypothetical protein n=1 Tax=Bradyrhizobium TaxID=374 RepID=UPI001FCCBEF5|nr:MULTISPECIES: hypothetical protein [Bradyrhizobium]
MKLLEEIERLLTKASNRADYRLADYFDYVAETSIGGRAGGRLTLVRDADRQTAIDDDLGARKIRGRVTEQEQHYLRHFRRLGCPPKRNGKTARIESPLSSKTRRSSPRRRRHRK